MREPFIDVDNLVMFKVMLVLRRAGSWADHLFKRLGIGSFALRLPSTHELLHLFVNDTFDRGRVPGNGRCERDVSGPAQQEIVIISRHDLIIFFIATPAPSIQSVVFLV